MHPHLQKQLSTGEFPVEASGAGKCLEHQKMTSEFGKTGGFVPKCDAAGNYE